MSKQELNAIANKLAVMSNNMAGAISLRSTVSRGHVLGWIDDARDAAVALRALADAMEKEEKQ